MRFSASKTCTFLLHSMPNSFTIHNSKHLSYLDLLVSNLTITYLLWLKDCTLEPRKLLGVVGVYEQ